ncbi:MAG: hypothetical protein OJJ54_17885 [Pseudonocardia sp.]|nr:hypothetical protein [Pseudonocardia sp.]
MNVGLLLTAALFAVAILLAPGDGQLGDGIAAALLTVAGWTALVLIVADDLGHRAATAWRRRRRVATWRAEAAAIRREVSR